MHHGRLCCAYAFNGCSRDELRKVPGNMRTNWALMLMHSRMIAVRYAKYFICTQYHEALYYLNSCCTTDRDKSPRELEQMI
jgi:hypothetical protein